MNPVDNPVELLRNDMKAQDDQSERHEDPKLALAVGARIRTSTISEYGSGRSPGTDCQRGSVV